MAIFNGIILDFLPVIADDKTYPFVVTPSANTRERYEYPYYKTYETSGIFAGTLVDTQPIDEPISNHGGWLFSSFADLYYNSIHITPSFFELGKIFDPQEETFVIWNAYFAASTLQSITIQDLDGVEIEEPDSRVFVALEEKTFKVKIGVEGSVIISGKVVFDFAVDEVSLSLTGQRGATPWSFPPQKEFTESIEWKTDVLKSRDGEQRLSLRDVPRRTISYSNFFKQESYYAFSQNLIKYLPHQDFAVPLWYHLNKVGNLKKDITTIEVDTESYDYKSKQELFIYESPFVNELATIDSVGEGFVELSYPITSDYKNAMAIPIIYSRAIDGLTASVINKEIVSTSISFVDCDYEITSSHDYDLYLDLPVMSDRIVLSGDINESISQSYDLIDSGIGRFDTYDTEKYTRKGYTVSWLKLCAKELNKLKKFFFFCAGMYQSFWLPSQREDMKLANNIVGGQDTMSIDFVGLSLHSSVGFCCIYMKDCTKKYFKMISITKKSGLLEEIKLDEAFLEDIFMEDVSFISIMNLVRFDSDRIEINYKQRESTVTIPCIEVNLNELE